MGLCCFLQGLLIYFISDLLVFVKRFGGEDLGLWFDLKFLVFIIFRKLSFYFGGRTVDLDLRVMTFCKSLSFKFYI